MQPLKEKALGKKKPGSLRLRGPAARRLAKKATTVAFLRPRPPLPTYFAPSVGKTTNERFITKRLRKPERRRESHGRKPSTFRADKKYAPRRAERGGASSKKKPGSHLLSRREGTIIGARELDFRVRDGNGYCLSAMAAGHNNLSHRPSRGIKMGRQGAQKAPWKKKTAPSRFRAEGTIWPSLAAY